MNEENVSKNNGDPAADAVAAIVVLLVAVTAVVYWLSRF